jgi:hypothetical protein
MVLWGKRAFKDAWEGDRVLFYLKEKSGVQFDPSWSPSSSTSTTSSGPTGRSGRRSGAMTAGAARDRGALRPTPPAGCSGTCPSLPRWTRFKLLIDLLMSGACPQASGRPAAPRPPPRPFPAGLPAWNRDGGAPRASHPCKLWRYQLPRPERPVPRGDPARSSACSETTSAASPVSTKRATQRSWGTSVPSGSPGWRPASSLAATTVKVSRASAVRIPNAAMSTSDLSLVADFSCAHHAARSGRSSMP